MRAPALLTIVVCAAACGATGTRAPGGAAVAAPAGCRAIAPADGLAALARVPGARLCLAPGRYPGPVAIAPGTIVWGPRGATIERPGGGTVVEVGARATLLGATVSGRGGVFDRADAAVKITGDGARVEGVAVVDAVFGITAERVAHATITGDVVDGSHDAAIGLRGDPIRLWETQDSTITGNTVRGGRDVVVWYSSGNHIEDNRIEDARYGTHLMYSHHNHVARNVYRRDVVGVFVMYSHDVELADNVVADAGGAAGMGVGLKDSGNLVVRGNAFVHDHTGLYLDQTPLQQGDTLEVDDNLFGRCDTAVLFHSSGHRDALRDNDFVDDGATVQVDGGGDASDVAWSGNYFDDYAGYDLDGDGTGDVPYELRSFAEDLTDRTPSLAFFHGTLALDVADAVTRLVPVYERRTLLVDPAPRMRAHAWEDLHAD
jgi:nitrous oxidase accessory protein